MRKKFIHIDEEGRVRVVRRFNKADEKTQQHFKDEVDINRIWSKYKASGELHHQARQAGVYADVSKISDYHSAMDKIMAADNAFGSLPADLRLRFKNDPALFLEFLRDPRNYDEGVKLGIYELKKEATAPATKNDDSNDKKQQGAPAS